jgi:glutathione S-transferase
MKLYANDKSRGLIVKRLLEVLEIDYDYVHVSFGAEMKTAEFKRLNPMGKVPVLVDGNVIVSETAAICIYLADKFSAKALAPSISDPLRGEYLKWMFFGAGPLDFAVCLKRLGLEKSTDNKGFLGFNSVSEIQVILEQHLRNNRYILGDQFSAVDIYLGTLVEWALRDNQFIDSKILKDYLSTALR